MPRKKSPEQVKQEIKETTIRKVWKSVIEELAEELEAKKDALYEPYKRLSNEAWRLRDERDNQLYDIYQGKDRHSGVLGEIREVREEYSGRLEQVRKAAEAELKQREDQYGDDWIEAETEKRILNLEAEAKKQFPDVKARIFFEGQDQIGENDDTLYVPVSIDEQNIIKDVQKSLDDSKASLDEITARLEAKKKEAENAADAKEKKEKEYNLLVSQKPAEDPTGSYQKQMDEAASALKEAAGKAETAPKEVAALEADLKSAQEYYGKFEDSAGNLKENISTIQKNSSDFGEKKEEKEHLENIAGNERKVLGITVDGSDYYKNLSTAIENYEKFMKENRSLGEGSKDIAKNVEKLNGLLENVVKYANEYTAKRQSWFKWTSSGSKRLELAGQAKKMAEAKMEQLKTVVKNAETREKIIPQIRAQYVNYRKDSCKWEVLNLRINKIARWEIDEKKNQECNRLIEERDAITKKIEDDYMRDYYHPITNKYESEINRLDKESMEYFRPYNKAYKEYKEAVQKVKGAPDRVSTAWIKKNMTFESFQEKVGEHLLRGLEKSDPKKFEALTQNMTREDKLESISEISADITRHISNSYGCKLSEPQPAKQVEAQKKAKIIINPELKSMFGF